ncbi:hypothetical protein B0H13DRAFT_1862173 [Mycena leptocephala]|nr:hypothetical protein B0H13DRAFT_1862173 [Mycena leptocephala]
MVELAQELIDLITEHTSTENKDSSCSGTWWRPTDHSTLTACALVAKAFVVPSQRCLFRSVELDRQGIMCTVFAQSLILTSEFTVWSHIPEGMRMDHPSQSSSGLHFLSFFGFPPCDALDWLIAVASGLL